MKGELETQMEMLLYSIVTQCLYELSEVEEGYAL